MKLTWLVKDLGVVVDYELKLHKHVAEVVKKANQRLGIIIITFSLLNENVILQCYMTLVRSLLEYGNIVWYPRFVLDQRRVESVQRRATCAI